MHDNHTTGSDRAAHKRVFQYKTGELVIDEVRMKLGVVMDRVGGRLQLRPPAGGTEWDCDPQCARRPQSDQVMTASSREQSP